MTSAQLIPLLLWCTGINYCILLIWFAVFYFGHDWLYKLHSRWFKLSEEMFDSLNYAGIAVYKIGVMLLNLAPLLALYITSP